MSWRIGLLTVVVMAAQGSMAHADWRPCGPGNSCGGNRLIRQGFFGADFRSACAQHDACYAAGGNRKACDVQFRNNMYAACACSDNPARCQRKANHYYRAARLFGGLF